MDAEKDQEEESKILGEDDTGDEEDEAEDGGKESVMERYCGVGRVWIFIALGVLMLVFSAVLAGVHMNVRVVTSSLEQVEVVPAFLPAAMGGVAGVLVLLLFWRRYKVLVYGALTLCVGTAVLCVVASVLTGTHVLRPLLSVSGCVYQRQEKACRCLSTYHRVGISLLEVPRGDHVFLTMEGTLGCDDVHTVLPGLMYTMVGVYGVVALVCMVAGVIALLVYKTELRRKQSLEYDDHFMSPSNQQLSESQTEHNVMIPLQPCSKTCASMLLKTYINPGSTANDEDNNDGNTTPSDLVYSPADVPMEYTEACRMRRCQSFNQPRRGSLQEDRPESSASSQTACFAVGDRHVGRAAEGPSKLKSHRKKGRRAVTLHGLDREQLLLILSLQMRYLQELDQSAKKEDIYKNAGKSNINGDRAVSGDSHDSSDNTLLFAQMQRRALTPTPKQERLSSNRLACDDLDYRPAKLVRSHTPQPHHFRTTNEYNPSLHKHNQSQYQSGYPQQKHEIQQQQSPDDDDEQPTMITFDLRNIKTGPVLYDHPSSARSSLSGCGPDSSCSSNNSSLTCSIASPLQSKMTGVQSSNLQGQLSAEPILQDKVKSADDQDLKEFKHQTSQMSDSSQLDCSNFPSDIRKLSSEQKLTSEQEPTENQLMKFSKNEDFGKKSDHSTRASSRSTSLCRTNSNSSRTSAGADRWQAVMGAQTLWENVQRKAPLDPIVLSTHQVEAATPDVGCCMSSHSNKAQNKHGSTVSLRSSELVEIDPSSQVIQTGQLDNFNVIFNNLPGTKFVSQPLPVTLNPNNLLHKNLTTAPKSVPSNTHHNTFIPIDSSLTDNSEDTDQMDSSPQQSDCGPVKQDVLSEVRVPSRFEEQQTAKADHLSRGAQPRSSDRSQFRSMKYIKAFDREVASATHFNDPLNTSSQVMGQCVETGDCMTTNREMEGSFRGREGRYFLDRFVQSERHHDLGRFLDGDGKHIFDISVENGRQRDLVTSVEEDRKHVFDRSVEDSRRRIIHRSLDNDGYYPKVKNTNAYVHSHRQSRSSTKPMPERNTINKSMPKRNTVNKSTPERNTNKSMSDHSLSQVYHNPYAVQATSNTSRHASTNRSQNSAFYTLGHGNKTDSLHYSHAPQEVACDTDLDSLPAPQWKGQCMRGQSLPPLALYHSLESVARPVPTRSGFPTSFEPQGTHYTSSELQVSRGSYQDPRPNGQSWNPNPSRYPSCQSGLATDHRYYMQQNPHHPSLKWQPQNSHGLSREQLHVDSQRQPHVNIRRCQSVDEGNRSTRSHLYTGSYRPGQQNGGGGFYQNINALRAENNVQCADRSALHAEMENEAASRSTGSHIRQPVFKSYQTSGDQALIKPALLSKKILTDNIAEYVGVAKLVDSSDSDDFVETVI